MSLQDKYSKVIDFAKKPQVDNLSVSENNGVLYISGTATSAVKDKMWELYNQIDPDMRSGDVVMNIQVSDDANGQSEVYEVKQGDSLSKIAQHYQGMTWQKIYEANKDVIKDPNVIHPGWKIKIPK